MYSSALGSAVCQLYLSRKEGQESYLTSPTHLSSMDMPRKLAWRWPPPLRRSLLSQAPFEGRRAGWEEPYPMRHKPCSKTPGTARSSLVPPSLQLEAQTSPGSLCETNLQGTSCGAWAGCKPRCRCCWPDDGTPEFYWGSWCRQRDCLDFRHFPVHCMYKMMTLEGCVAMTCAKPGPPTQHSIAHSGGANGHPLLPHPPAPLTRTLAQPWASDAPTTTSERL